GPRRRPGLILRPWLRTAALPRRLLLRAGAALVEHCATAWAELRHVRAEAGDDAVDIRNLRTAQPPDVGRARHLVIHGSAIVFRVCGRRQCCDAADCDGKAENNTLRCHV